MFPAFFLLVCRGTGEAVVDSDEDFSVEVPDVAALLGLVDEFSGLEDLTGLVEGLSELVEGLS